MESVFKTVLNMSLSGAVVILGIMLLRLPLKKAPKKWSYLLWLAAAFRLCCPLSFGSALSLFSLLPNKAAPVGESVAAGLTTLDYIRSTAAPAGTVLPTLPPVTQAATAVPSAAPTALLTSAPTVVPTAVPVTAVPVTSAPSAAPIAGLVTSAPGQVGGGHTVTLLGVLCAVWLLGMAAMLVYGAVSYIKLKRKNAAAMPLEKGGRALLGDNVSSPYILGVLRPRIYVPYGLEGEALKSVLAHEERHIKRGDHIVKTLSFAILALHWFNPLCWLGFILMSRDMELSCDEQVAASLDGPARKRYAETLLAFAELPRFPSPNPLCFGESAVSSRIRTVAEWKKPKRAVSITAAVLAVLFIAGCALNPKRPSSKDDTPEPDETEAHITTLAPATAPPMTAEPQYTVPANAVYGPGQIYIEETYVPNPGAVKRIAPKNDTLDDSSYANSVFAVTIGLSHMLNDSKEEIERLRSQLEPLINDPAFQRHNVVVQQCMNTDEYAVMYDAYLMQRGHVYDDEMLSDAFWRAYSTLEEQYGYEWAQGRMNAIRDEFLKDEVMEEVERLRGLGLDVYYESGGRIRGFLTAEQIKAFPAGNKHGFTMTWTTDPKLRLDLNKMRAEQAEKIGALSVTDYVGSGLANFAVLEDGTLWAWGEGGSELGAGNTHGEPIVPPALIMKNVRKVISPRSEYCAFAISTDGTLYGWGRNTMGQLGLGDRDERFFPTFIMHDVQDVFAFDGSVFALATDGSLWSWGSNMGGRLGQGNGATNVAIPKKILDGVHSIAWQQGWETGYVTSDEVYAVCDDFEIWGWGGRFGDRSVPRLVFEDATMVWPCISVCYGLDFGGGLWAWGGNGRDPLTGCGNAEVQAEPVMIFGNDKYVYAFEYIGHSDSGPHDCFVVDPSGGLWGWGSNRGGELGTGDKEPRYAPVHIMDGIEAVYACDTDMVLALGKDGTLYSWGSDPHGALGTGGTEQLTPKAILTDVKSCDIRSSELMSWYWSDTEDTVLTACSAILEDGSLWVWGFNRGNLLGLGHGEMVTVPTKAAEHVRRHMALANDYLTEDGKLVAWAFVPERSETPDEVDLFPRVIASGVKKYIPGLYGWRAVILGDGTLLVRPVSDSVIPEEPVKPFGK